MIKRLAWGMGLASLAGGATIAGAQTATATATTPAKPDKPKRICRSEVAVGSIMPTRTCHTKDEWASIDRANGDATRQANDPRGRFGGVAEGARDGSGGRPPS